jgi:hypothetical protein
MLPELCWRGLWIQILKIVKSVQREEQLLMFSWISLSKTFSEFLGGFYFVSCFILWKNYLPNNKDRCSIWDYRSGGCEEFFLLGYNAISPLKVNRTFQRNDSPPSSGRRISQAGNQCESKWQSGPWFFAWITLRSWRWKLHVLPKGRFDF